MLNPLIACVVMFLWFLSIPPPPDLHPSMQSPDGNQLWCPGQSLWSLIAEHVSGSELPEIRTALGQSLVDLYTKVHAEVRGLLGLLNVLFLLY